MARIETPVAGFTGDGPGGLHFVDGVAETDDVAIIGYCRGAGYLIDNERTNPVAAGPAPSQADPRDITTTVVGARLRDAAVSPKPGDFQAPVNAGEANPHGPEVYAPGLPGGPQPPAPPAGPEADGQADGDGREAGAVTPAPDKGASVAEWRQWVISSVVDNDPEVHAQVEKMTKAELIKQYGG
ncbi:hypothetical protein J3A78_003505 [Streptomyces sp. PvR006]|uniref:hypothetical protein n=1 Tax=Streptomyces sp. PvR006 TaxID=2817860 RepID=UPI001AEACD32|nr:hypothetical protein [Streptomyces sp. PvR006]MBP2583027.1 hypothetical protein [Streptomyces sp. PvR006]